MKIALIIIILTFAATSSYSQSAWVQDKEHGYAELGYSQIGSYDKLFSEDSDEVNLGQDIQEQLIKLYAEYGISDRITLIASIPYFKASVDNGSESSHSNLGNIRVGSRFHLYSGKYELSAQVDIDANTSDFDDSTGISTGYDAWTFSPYLNIGRGFGRFYAQAFVGANFRTDNYSHSFRVGLEIGAKVLDSLIIAGVIDLQESLKNGDVNLPASALRTGLFVNDQEFISTGIKIIWNIKPNYGISASFIGATSGNFVPKAPSTNLGFFAKF